MTEEQLRLEIVKAIYPVYKDIMSFKRVADDIYNWIAPKGLKSETENIEINAIAKGYKKGPGGRLFPINNQ